MTHETLFGLLAASGLRIGEALGLCRDDVDLAAGVLTIREAKFRRSRLVPVHPTTTAALGAYAGRRDRQYPQARSSSFFVSTIGTALGYGGVCHMFIQLTTAMRLRTATVCPRIHDLRHSFAVQTLIDWYRSGVDVAARMAVLSTYLGHVNPVGTYWYLSATPELVELAATRLEDSRGAQR